MVAFRRKTKANFFLMHNEVLQHLTHRIIVKLLCSQFFRRIFSCEILKHFKKSPITKIFYFAIIYFAKQL
jgi:hypothetical protein